MAAEKHLFASEYCIISHVNPQVSLIQSIPLSARPVVDAVVAAQTRCALFSSPSDGATIAAPVVVGLSGGADSVCLLHVLWLLASKWKLTLHAAHLDHGLRGESRADAAFAADLAAELGVQFHVRRLDGRALSSDPRGVEAAARAKRYEFLAEVAASVATAPHPPTVAVAHHMDDQAETVLMNFVRGSGLRGLGGMPWMRELAMNETQSRSGDDAPQQSVRLVRPLLSVRGSQLADYLHAYNLSHCEDLTNLDTNRLRNRIRHETLPTLTRLNPQIVETIARTAELLRAEAERADDLDRKVLADITVEIYPLQRTVFDLEQFNRYPLAARRGALRLAIEQMGLDIRDVGFDNIEYVLWQACTRQSDSGPHTLSEDVMWTVIAGRPAHAPFLSLHRREVLPWQPPHPHLANPSLQVEIPCPLICPGVLTVTPDWNLRCGQCAMNELPAGWQARGHPWRAFLDADRVQVPELTVPSAGMSFSPLGMPDRHKQLGDFFTDRKILPVLRKGWPIVVDEAVGTVLWVCGHAVSHRARVSAATRRILVLEWLPAQHTARQPGTHRNTYGE
jgi:tRNA(Ile)-lysidine synthase